MLPKERLSVASNTKSTFLISTIPLLQSVYERWRTYGQRQNHTHYSKDERLAELLGDSGDFLVYGLQCGQRIASLGDGPADDEIAGAGLQGQGGGHDA